MIRAELSSVIERLVDGAARWQDAYRYWEDAVVVRDRLAARLERELLAATGGLSAPRFEAVWRRRSVRSVAEAQQKASAIRARAAVQVALAERDLAVAAADGTVLGARIVLAEASKVILGYGTAGPSLVGRSRADLRRLARFPARTVIN